MLGQIQRIVISGAATLLLAGCSFIEAEHPASDNGLHSRAWTYQKVWEPVDFPPNLANITSGKVTITGQCHLSGSLLKPSLGQKRTILMPFLLAGNDGSVAPAFKKSLPVYKALEQYLQLAPTPESIQLYQRWVSSLEQACPEGLSRKISQCSLKNLYSIGGLWGGKSLYDFERLNHWLAQNTNNRLLLTPNFSLLSSKAALGLKYSSNAYPVVNQTNSQRLAAVIPHLGRQSLDWVALNDESQLNDELVSSGRCSVIWQELEHLRNAKNTNKLTIEQLDQVSKALIPVLLSFMNDALTRLDAPSH